DIVVKRTIDRNVRTRVAGNLFTQEVVLKYEIENFKPQAVTLTLVENLRYVRDQLVSSSGRDVQWELGKDTTLSLPPDKEKSTFEQVVFRAPLPARGNDGKAEK